MGKIELNKKLKQDALLNIAFDLFTSQGIQKTSISDIVEKAGVAKGTFYLYFKDKYDIRNKLIAHKASQLFKAAEDAFQRSNIKDEDIESKIIFLVDHIVNQLSANKILLNFISKNLSWGIFKNVLISSDDLEIDFYNIFTNIFENSEQKFKDPEVLVFMIVELTSSTCYSAILYNEPVPIEQLKPYLFETIRQMIRSQELP